jgi:hypothetical protein
MGQVDERTCAPIERLHSDMQAHMQAVTASIAGLPEGGTLNAVRALLVARQLDVDGVAGEINVLLQQAMTILKTRCATKVVGGTSRVKARRVRTCDPCGKPCNVIAPSGG